MKDSPVLAAALFVVASLLFSVIACGVILGDMPRSHWFGDGIWSVVLFFLWIGSAFTVGRVGAGISNCTASQRIVASMIGILIVVVFFFVFGARPHSLELYIRKVSVLVSMGGLLLCGLIASFLPRQPTESLKWSIVAFLLQLSALASYFNIPYYRYRPYVLAILIIGIPTPLYAIGAMSVHRLRVQRALSVTAVVILAIFVSIS